MHRKRRRLSFVMPIIYCILALIMADTMNVRADAADALCYSDFESYNLYSYEISNVTTGNKSTTYNKGYYLVPEKDGKYPVLFLFHGAGGIGDYKKNVVAMLNKWVALDMIEPMIVILPEVDQYADTGYGVEDDRQFIANNHFEKLLNKVKNGEWEFSDKVDSDQGISVAGYSLGASMALYAGHKYPDDIVNIGAASPSTHAYLGDGKWGWMNHESDVTFSLNADAHFLLGYGQAEKSSYGEYANRVNTAHENNKINNPDYTANSFMFYSGYKEGHVWNTFKREIFAFLFYLKNDKLPDDSVIENVCATDNIEYSSTDDQTENEKKVSEQQEKEQGASEQETKEQASSEQNTTELKSTEQSTTEQKISDNKSTKKKNTKKKNTKKKTNKKTTKKKTTKNNSTKKKPVKSKVKKNDTKNSNSIIWKKNNSGKWIENEKGQYPVNKWMQINGSWYYFGTSGYMAENEWVDGCWLSSNGKWIYKYRGSWRYILDGWRYEDTSGWYAVGWQKIDGSWYYFDSSGKMIAGQYIDGYWIGMDGICHTGA